MSLRKSLRLTLLGITLFMVFGYSWLMEANLASGVLFSSEIRLNRAADAWIESETKSAIPSTSSHKAIEPHLLPTDGTPVIYETRDSLPVAVLEHIPETLLDKQFTVIETDEIGLLNIGYLLHLFRTLPNGENIHVVQRLMLAEYEIERVQQFDALMYKRSMIPGAVFILTTLFIVLLFGHRVAKGTTQLLNWCESLSIQSLPDAPPKLPFLEMQQIAAGALATVQRESEAIEHRHQFLRFASHELRTPLAIASANAELLARHGVGENGQEALDRLDDAIQNMNSLTNALLWLGRGETPLPEPEPVDLLLLVNTIVEENGATAVRNNLTVEVTDKSGIHPIQPRVLLVILCSNLIGNAIRYTCNGKVMIRLSGETIEIENQGEQLGPRASGGGHGLGLQLVAWVIERAGWTWYEDGDESFQRHSVHLTALKK